MVPPEKRWGLCYPLQAAAVDDARVPEHCIGGRTKALDTPKSRPACWPSRALNPGFDCAAVDHDRRPVQAGHGDDSAGRFM